MKSLKRKAFTLAEVLVVMGLIGVVASLTLPNLKNNSDTQVNVSRAKKVYSELATALDRYTLKNTATPSSWTASYAMSGMNKYLKTKGTSSDYWFDKGTTESPNSCATVATALDDGSTYCIIPYASSTACLDVLFDVDGPKKGMNAVGYDIFYASIQIPAVIDSPEMVAWSCSDSGSFTSSDQPDTTNYLNWVMLYDNLDYRKCGDDLYYQSVTTCN